MQEVSHLTWSEGSMSLTNGKIQNSTPKATEASFKTLDQTGFGNVSPHPKKGKINTFTYKKYKG
jgi:hypothetical protein